MSSRVYTRVKYAANQFNHRVVCDTWRARSAAPGNQLRQTAPRGRKVEQDVQLLAKSFVDNYCLLTC